MASSVESAHIKISGFNHAMESNIRSRATSQSTDGGFAPSVFSVAESFATAGSSPPRSDDENYVFGKTNNGGDEDLEEISKETFEANVYGTNPQTSKSDNNNPKIIDGSTLGGKDPLHAMVRGTQLEPTWWIKDRDSEMRRNKRLKYTSSKSLFTPSYFDSLPYSPQDVITSGLNQDEDPEVDGKEFWDKVTKAWDLSCRFETVAERRDQFKYKFFDAGSEPPSPSRFNDELSVV